MSFTFFPNIPNAPNDPADDQPDMLQNNVATNALIAIDHVGFNNPVPNGGYHTIIHQGSASRTRSGVGAVIAGFPAAIPGINQFFSADYTPDTTGGVADTQLFSVTGAGEISQLTAFLTRSVDGKDGYQWIGGALLQWGTTLFSGGNSHETSIEIFKDRQSNCIPFPNNIYVVIPTLLIASTSTTTASNTIAIRQQDKDQFTWVFNSSSSNGSTLFPGFSWIAIGA